MKPFESAFYPVSAGAITPPIPGVITPPRDTGIVERIRALEAGKQAKLLALAFEGDYQTPTCVACGVKMVQRQGKGGSFWGCRNYPKCKVTMARAAQSK